MHSFNIYLTDLLDIIVKIIFMSTFFDTVYDMVMLYSIVSWYLYLLSGVQSFILTHWIQNCFSKSYSVSKIFNLVYIHGFLSDNINELFMYVTKNASIEKIVYLNQIIRICVVYDHHIADICKYLSSHHHLTYSWKMSISFSQKSSNVYQIIWHHFFSILTKICLNMHLMIKAVGNFFMSKKVC